MKLKFSDCAAIWLRWLANYGLSLSAADYAVPGPEERESACPFAQMLKAQQKLT